MLTAISSYLFGDGTDECILETDVISESDDVVEDWIFVNHANSQGKQVAENADKKGNMAESWYVTPPSCFDRQSKRGKKYPPTSTLENLLIEHPSMSVYAPNAQADNNTDQAEGASPKKTAVRAVVNPKQADNRRLQHGKVFLNQPVNKRAPLQELGCNYENSVAFSFSRKGAKRSNNVHHRFLAGRYSKKESRRDGKHGGMVAQRGVGMVAQRGK